MYSAKEGDILSGAPIVIIADHTTRGTGEIFAFAMGNRKRAVIMGSLTYGSGYVEDVFELTGGRKAQFAVGSVQSPEGRPLDRIGVVPLVCLASFRKLSDADEFVNMVMQDKFTDTRPKLDNPTQDEITAARKACPAGYPTLKIQKLATDIAQRIVYERDAYPRLKDM
jgi:carboxyl-terminal processing protease